MPPGWESWAAPVQGNAYAQSHYRLNVNGTVDADFREDYLDSWLGHQAVDLVDGSDGFDFADGRAVPLLRVVLARTRRTPTRRSSRAPSRDAQYPRTPDFDEADVSDKFGLTRTRKALTASDLATIDETFRKRIRSVQVLDQNVAELVQALADQGALDNTYMIFTSDNGYIMGNHRREIGKYNQFQGTVNVPFYVRGPGITPGSTYDDVAGNIDIAPTIAEMAGARTPRRGRRLAAVAAARRPAADAASTSCSAGPSRPPTPRRPTASRRRRRPTSRAAARAELNDFTGVTNGRYKLIRYTHLAARGALRPQERPVRARQPARLRRGVVRRDVAEGSAKRSTPSGRRWTG